MTLLTLDKRVIKFITKKPIPILFSDVSGNFAMIKFNQNLLFPCQNVSSLLFFITSSSCKKSNMF